MKDPELLVSFDGLVSLHEDSLMELFMTNPYTSDGSYSNTLFETFGKELAFVKAQPKNRIATLVDGDEGVYICHGYHYVNRLGYFVGAVELPDFGSLCVLVEGDDEELDDSPEPTSPDRVCRFSVGDRVALAYDPTSYVVERVFLDPHPPNFAHCCGNSARYLLTNGAATQVVKTAWDYQLSPRP